MRRQATSHSPARATSPASTLGDPKSVSRAVAAMMDSKTDEKLRSSRPAAHIHEGSVSSVRVGIDEAHDQLVVGRREDLAILWITRGRLEAEISLVRGPPFEPQFVELRIVGDMHHDTVRRSLRDLIGLAALGLCFALGTPAIFLVVERRHTPLPDQALPSKRGRSRTT